MTKNEPPSDTQPPMSDAEFLRRVEAERLDIERFRARMENSNAYLERWKLDVVDQRNIQMGVAHAATDFGKFTLRSIFLLNGGAMIALPAFGQLVDKIDASQLSSSLGWFAGGLFAVTVAMFLGYFSLSANGDSWRYAVERSAASLNQEQANEENKAGFDDAITTLETKRSKFLNLANGFELVAVIFAIMGLIAFVIGAYSGASMLTA